MFHAETVVSPELLTWLVGNLSAFYLRRMLECNRIMHAKLSPWERRICLDLLISGFDVCRILQRRLNESTPLIFNPFVVGTNQLNEMA